MGSIKGRNAMPSFRMIDVLGMSRIFLPASVLGIFYFHFMELEWLRKICTSLPAVTEDIKWGYDLVFSVGGRMFCVASLEEPFGCSFKVKDEEFEEMSNREGFIPAPYMARAKWVKLDSPSRLNKKEWQQYLKQSYELVKAKLTKKERALLGI